jgi:hypothetical protein
MGLALRQHIERDRADVAKYYFDHGDMLKARAMAIELMNNSEDHRVRARMAELITKHNFACLQYEKPAAQRVEHSFPEKIQVEIVTSR